MGFGKEEGSGPNILVSLVVFLIIALGGMYIISNQTKPQNFYLSQQQEKNTISVQGEAKTKVSPNLVQISFTIETNDTASAKVAQDKNADVTANVKKQLLTAGLTEQDISTIQFTVEPIKKSVWECPPPEDRKCDYYDRIYNDELIGYRAVHQLFVKSGDTTNAGALLDAISAGSTYGANNYGKIDSVAFTLKYETKKELERDLLEKASADAKNKAQKIASGTGVSLAKPVSISESVDYPVYYNYNYAPRSETVVDTAAIMGDTRVFAGQVDVTAKVSATFEVN